jgi:hypothetical protein
MPENPYEPPKEYGISTVAPAIGSMIRVAGQLTLDDFDQIQTLYGGGGFARWQARFTYTAVVVIWLTFVGLDLFAAGKPLAEQLTTIGRVHYVFGGGVALIGLFWWLQYSLRRNLQKQHRNQEGLFAPQELDFTDDGIEVRTSLIQSQLSWDAFSSARLNQDYLVLNLKPEGSAALYIARSWFPDDNAWRRLFDFVLHRLPEVK